MAHHLEPRHGATPMPKNGYMVYHWGYGNEVLPCESDLATCEYLNGVYVMHDVSMKYSFILWGVLLGIMVVWVMLRGWRMGGPAQRIGGVIDQMCDAGSRAKRRWLLQDNPFTSVFGRTTRLQVAILAIILGYLLIFSFTGIIWKRWDPPHPQTSKTRTALGWWSNRVGILSYALTPFTVLLATRENLLTILTGIPYQHFNFLHRWLGRVIFIQGMLHTIGWTVVEAYFYKPSPLIYVTFLKNMYAVFGCVAVFFICFLTLFSLKPVIRWTGYEFFKLTHSIAAVFYLGAIWGHWDKLWCWIVASFVLIVLDQGARMIRTCYIHFGGQKRNIGFRRARAEVQVLGEGEDVVVRLDFDFEHDAWAAGQHFYLCFPSLSIWQSHPFTVVSAPQISRSVQRHTYILRPRSGLTAGLVGLHGQNDVAVVLSGPYGPACPGDITETTENVLAVGGGTGVTFTLPIAIAAVQQFFVVPHPFVDFVWVIRHAHDLLWLETELTALKAMLSDNPGFRIHIFVTRDQEGQLPVLSEEPRKCPSMTKDPEKGGDVSVASLMTSQMSGRNAGLHALLNSEDERFRVEFLGGRHPSMGAIVDSFMEGARKRGGYAQVFGSGPEAMGSDLRSAVAEVEEVDGLRFYWDSRD